MRIAAIGRGVFGLSEWHAPVGAAQRVTAQPFTVAEDAPSVRSKPCFRFAQTWLALRGRSLSLRSSNGANHQRERLPRRQQRYANDCGRDAERCRVQAPVPIQRCMHHQVANKQHAYSDVYRSTVQRRCACRRHSPWRPRVQPSPASAHRRPQRRRWSCYRRRRSFPTPQRAARPIRDPHNTGHSTALPTQPTRLGQCARLTYFKQCGDFIT